MTKSGSGNKQPTDRKQRLAEALKANLQRRKSQARGRKVEDRVADEDAADERD